MTIVLGRVPRENAADALACKSLDVKFNVKKVAIDLDHLFGGDDDLGESYFLLLEDAKINLYLKYCVVPISFRAIDILHSFKLLSMELVS